MNETNKRTQVVLAAIEKNPDMDIEELIKKMGWTVERKKAAKPRLYDPETGDYLNDATMKVIENARKGKDVIEVGSMDDYLKLVNNL